jgi:formate-dependent nitrite reductase cytochrome c552 subunit
MRDLFVNRDLPSWILPGFLILAIFFILTPGDRPMYPEAADARSFIGSNKARSPRFAPVYKRRITSPTAYECDDCHRNFLEPYSVGKQRDIIGEHTQITFDHGEENLCFNCHNREKREVLKAVDGSELPFSRALELCITCHGPRYRDWKLGIHGKMSGSWDPARSSGNTRLNCLECHDPHSPGHHDMAPAPAPAHPGPVRGGHDVHTDSVKHQGEDH